MKKKKKEKKEKEEEQKKRIKSKRKRKKERKKKKKVKTNTPVIRLSQRALFPRQNCILLGHLATFRRLCGVSELLQQPKEKENNPPDTHGV